MSREKYCDLFDTHNNTYDLKNSKDNTIASEQFRNFHRYSNKAKES